LGTTTETAKRNDPVVVNNFCAIGIIFPRDEPSTIFTDVKWQYPVKAFDNMVYPQGGNWFGEDAAKDRGPRETLIRELGEELSFDHPADPKELTLILGVANPVTQNRMATARDVTDADRLILKSIVEEIQTGAVPFADFLSYTPKSVLDAADPENQRGDITAIVSAWLIPVSRATWAQISNMQLRFGNLSNESRSAVLSLNDMIERNIHAAFGYDRILQAFWLAMGLNEAKKLPLVDRITHDCIGTPRASWVDYLIDFNPTKRPPGF